MNAYFQICVIFATRVYKSLIDISRWLWGSEVIPIRIQIINNKQKRAAQWVARFLRLWGHGCYVFSMGFFISYLRHICDTSYLAIRYNLNWYKPFITRRMCQEEITPSKDVARSAVKSLLLPHWCQSIVALLVPNEHTRKDKSQKRKKRYAKHWLDGYHPAKGI